jgi:hypothetical protein
MRFIWIVRNLDQFVEMPEVIRVDLGVALLTINDCILDGGIAVATH